MPCRYVIDTERGLVISLGWDRVTFAEIQAHFERLVKDPDFHSEFNQFVDGTAVTALEISAQEAKVIAGRRFFSPTSRRAFLASNLKILGMARVIETAAGMVKDREQVRCFTIEKKRWSGRGSRTSTGRGFCFLPEVLWR